MANKKEYQTTGGEHLEFIQPAVSTIVKGLVSQIHCQEHSCYREEQDRTAKATELANTGDNHEKYLPQRGASFLLNDKNQLIYKFFSSDVLGYSSNMRDPLGFLSDLIKE